MIADPLELRRLPVRSLLSQAQAFQDDKPQLRQAAGGERVPVRVAVVGSFTTQFIKKILDLFLWVEGLDAELYDAPYGSLEQSILDPGSELYRHAPQVVILLLQHRDLHQFPPLLAGEAEAEQLARAEAERWQARWRTLLQRLPARIVQGNFDLPLVRPLGNLDASVPYGRGPFVERVNRCLAQALLPGVTLFDLAGLEARFGLERAQSQQSYHLSKQPFAFDFLPHCCFALARLVAAALGRARKGLVLDLDGTLWGGVLGDDGSDGLLLGPTSPLGEAFTTFQRYVKELKERGVVLAVCSKNDEAKARAVFATHPEMVLRPDDIACFVANWEDKAANLLAIARTLNLGLDSLVYVDDSAQERHRIRQALPQVAVVELPEEPADYIAAVEAGAYFELLDLTTDAVGRSGFYQREQQRQALETAIPDYAAYLQSLELRAAVEPIDAANLQRVAELVARTNQWNLRTVRRGPAEIGALLARPEWQGFAVRLDDRFGSHGLIAVVLLQRQPPDGLFVDTWLMSCRVFKKTVEGFVFEEILARSRQLGVRKLLGEFRATEKNGNVALLYPELGFKPGPAGDPGCTRWSLALDEDAGPPSRPRHFIERMAPRERAS